MRRAIGMFLAFLIIPTTAFAKTPEKSSSYPPGQPHGAEPGKADIRIGTTRTLSCETARTREDPGDPYWGPTHTTGRSEYGKAAWYGLEGNYTSSGEMLDTVTATPAHRTLPLHSYAQVTNPDSGRSLIVKIHDCGPDTRGPIIDPS